MNWEGKEGVYNTRLTQQFMSLTTSTKLRVFGSNVKIVLLYGAETWETDQGTEPEVAGVF